MYGAGAFRLAPVRRRRHPRRRSPSGSRPSPPPSPSRTPSASRSRSPSGRALRPGGEGGEIDVRSRDRGRRLRFSPRRLDAGSMIERARRLERRYDDAPGPARRVPVVPTQAAAVDLCRVASGSVRVAAGGEPPSAASLAAYLTRSGCRRRVRPKRRRAGAPRPPPRPRTVASSLPRVASTRPADAAPEAGSSPAPAPSRAWRRGRSPGGSRSARAARSPAR